MGISVASRKAKGRKLQQLVAKALADKYQLTYGQDQDVQSREMGQSGTDVRLTPLLSRRYHLISNVKQLRNLLSLSGGNRRWTITRRGESLFWFTSRADKTPW